MEQPDEAPKRGRHKPIRPPSPSPEEGERQTENMAPKKRDSVFRRLGLPKDCQLPTDLCLNWKTRGSCGYGDSCRFAHPPQLTSFSSRRGSHDRCKIGCDSFKGHELVHEEGDISTKGGGDDENSMQNDDLNKCDAEKSLPKSYALSSNVDSPTDRFKNVRAIKHWMEVDDECSIVPMKMGRYDKDDVRKLPKISPADSDNDESLRIRSAVVVSANSTETADSPDKKVNKKFSHGGFRNRESSHRHGSNISPRRGDKFCNSEDKLDLASAKDLEKQRDILKRRLELLGTNENNSESENNGRPHSPLAHSFDRRHTPSDSGARIGGRRDAGGDSSKRRTVELLTGRSADRRRIDVGHSRDWSDERRKISPGHRREARDGQRKRDESLNRHTRKSEERYGDGIDRHHYKTPPMQRNSFDPRQLADSRNEKSRQSSMSLDKERRGIKRPRQDLVLGDRSANPIGGNFGTQRHYGHRNIRRNGQTQQRDSVENVQRPLNRNDWADSSYGRSHSTRRGSPSDHFTKWSSSINAKRRSDAPPRVLPLQPLIQRHQRQQSNFSAPSNYQQLQKRRVNKLTLSSRRKPLSSANAVPLATKRSTYSKGASRFHPFNKLPHEKSKVRRATERRSSDHDESSLSGSKLFSSLKEPSIKRVKLDESHSKEKLEKSNNKNVKKEKIEEKTEKLVSPKKNQQNEKNETAEKEDLDERHKSKGGVHVEHDKANTKPSRDNREKYTKHVKSSLVSSSHEKNFKKTEKLSPSSKHHHDDQKIVVVLKVDVEGVSRDKSPANDDQPTVAAFKENFATTAAEQQLEPISDEELTEHETTQNLDETLPSNKLRVELSELTPDKQVKEEKDQSEGVAPAVEQSNARPSPLDRFRLENFLPKLCLDADLLGEELVDQLESLVNKNMTCETSWRLSCSNSQRAVDKVAMLNVVNPRGAALSARYDLRLRRRLCGLYEELPKHLTMNVSEICMPFQEAAYELAKTALKDAARTPLEA